MSLVEDIRNGKFEAIKKLEMRFTPLISRVIDWYGISKKTDPDWFIKDVISDTVSYIARYPEKPIHLWSLIHIISVRKAIRVIQREFVRLLQDKPEPEPPDPPEVPGPVLRAEQMADLQRCMGVLTPTEAYVIKRVLEDYTLTEIAEGKTVTYHAVYQPYIKGVKKLKQCVEGERSS